MPFWQKLATKGPFRSLILLAFSLATLAFEGAQEPTRESQQDQRIRVVVDVVSVDAIVTDAEGRHVTDLGLEDFEVYENGRLQKITNLSYVRAVVPENRPGSSIPAELISGAILAEDVRRSIAIFVDDIGMSFENMAHVRDSLNKFIDSQIGPTDLVSISPAGTRTGILQAFTGDKRILRAAVDGLRWRPPFRASPLDRDAFDRQFSPIKRSETVYERSLAIGTLGALRFLIDSMRDLPGRKSVLLVSEGFRTLFRELEGVEGSTDLMVETLNRVIQAAHRAGVVIYTLDARTLEPLGLHPADDLSPVVRLAQEEEAEIVLRGDRRVSFLTAADLEKLLSPQAYDEIRATRLHQFQQTEQGLNFLPRATGGLYLSNTNDLSQSLERVLADQSGYYLIGYSPESSSVRKRGGRRFPRISVHLKKPGLKVRFRSSFMGISEQENRRPALEPEEQMIRLIQSPVGSDQVPLKLTALYEHDVDLGHSISCLLHIGSRGLTFQDQEDGWKYAEIEVLAVTFGENPKAVNEKSQTYRIRAKGETHQRLLKDGLAYRLTVPIKRPGPYQLRIVVRDRFSGRVGSASQFIEVPDLAAGGLALSGMVVQGTGGQKNPVGSSSEAPLAGMALRRFQAHMQLNYALYIYNARVDPKTSLPRLESQIVLFRDGRPIYTGEIRSHQFDDWKAGRPLMASGYLDLGSGLAAGHYVLEYRIADRLAPPEAGAASRWIDFEVVE